MSFRFRGAIGGFNRDDVIAYIRQLTENHQKERVQLLEELAQARAELEQLCTEMQPQREQGPESESADAPEDVPTAEPESATPEALNRTERYF